MTSGNLTGHKSTREHPHEAGGTTEASEGQHLAAHQRIHGDDKAANGNTGWATQACKTPTGSWKNTYWAAQRTAQESTARNRCSGIGIKRPTLLWVIVLCTVCHFINKTQGFNTSYTCFHDPLCIYLFEIYRLWAILMWFHLLVYPHQVFPWTCAHTLP